MAAPFGNALTSIVARAGYGLLKCAAIISFTTPNSFKSVRKICSKDTVVLQLVAFNHENGLFEKYLKTLEDCGFKEMKLKKNQ